MSSLAALAAEAESREPFVRFLERQWSRQALWQAASAAAPGLAALDLPDERPLGMLLPNLPSTVTALLACWLAGRPVAPVDGRRSMGALHDWSRRLQPAAIITLDLASVFERARALAAARGDCPLIVLPMSAELSLFKRIITPWLRGGGAAKRPDGMEIHRWPDLAKRSSAPTEARLEVRLEDGSHWTPAARDWQPGQVGLLACPLSQPAALEALLGAWCGGGSLVLSPRLDTKALIKVRKAVRLDLEVA
ncbi:MAG: AMP-binding protein [Pseudomonadota bacterium]